MAKGGKNRSCINSRSAQIRERESSLARQKAAGILTDSKVFNADQAENPAAGRAREFRS